jgi:hypothetical protein
MELVLGLDVSTSVVGWTALPSGSCASTYPDRKGHIDLRNVKGGFWAKVDVVDAALSQLASTFSASGDIVVRACVEEPLKKFTRGMSSAGTISLLARFNAIVSLFIRQKFCVEPLYVDATVARKKLGIPLQSRKKSGLGQKEQTAIFLNNSVFLHENWPKNKNGKLQPFVYDIIDSFVICAAGCIGLGETA